MLKKITAVIAALVAALTLGGGGSAQAIPLGAHIYTFTATSSTGLATAQVCAVKVAINSSRLCESDRAGEGWWISWGTTTDAGGGFRMNALCLDYEDLPGHYTQWHCLYAPSTTLDDVPTSGTASTADSPAVIYGGGDTPAYRVRFYGVCTGSCTNRIDDYQPIG